MRSHKGTVFIFVVIFAFLVGSNKNCDRPCRGLNAYWSYNFYACHQNSIRHISSYDGKHIFVLLEQANLHKNGKIKENKTHLYVIKYSSAFQFEYVKRKSLSTLMDDIEVKKWNTELEPTVKVKDRQVYLYSMSNIESMKRSDMKSPVGVGIVWFIRKTTEGTGGGLVYDKLHFFRFFDYERKITLDDKKKNSKKYREAHEYTYPWTETKSVYDKYGNPQGPEKRNVVNATGSPPTNSNFRHQFSRVLPYSPENTTVFVTHVMTQNSLKVLKYEWKLNHKPKVLWATMVVPNVISPNAKPPVNPEVVTTLIQLSEDLSKVLLATSIHVDQIAAIQAENSGLFFGDITAGQTIIPYLFVLDIFTGNITSAIILMNETYKKPDNVAETGFITGLDTQGNKLVISGNVFVFHVPQKRSYLNDHRSFYSVVYFDRDITTNKVSYEGHWTKTSFRLSRIAQIYQQSIPSFQNYPKRSMIFATMSISFPLGTNPDDDDWYVVGGAICNTFDDYSVKGRAFLFKDIKSDKFDSSLQPIVTGVYDKMSNALKQIIRIVPGTGNDTSKNLMFFNMYLRGPTEIKGEEFETNRKEGYYIAGLWGINCCVQNPAYRTAAAIFFYILFITSCVVLSILVLCFGGRCFLNYLRSRIIKRRLTKKID